LIIEPKYSLNSGGLVRDERVVAVAGHGERHLRLDEVRRLAQSSQLREVGMPRLQRLSPELDEREVNALDRVRVRSRHLSRPRTRIQF
jgi:hypothetical protein